MSLERDLERAEAAAESHARAGERVAAVMPAEPTPGLRVYLAAFESGHDLEYMLLDEDGVPVADLRLVRDAVSVIALSERAEEVSAAVSADVIAGRFDELAGRLAKEDAGASQAARDVAGAAREVASVADGVRLATPAYLDEVGAVAAALGAALDSYAEHAERLARPQDGGQPPGALAEAAWSALAEASAAGDPAGFAQAMTAATEAIEALADDVEARYRVAT
ncbi:MAG: hypothetical protein ACTHNU_04000 [Gaiellales bacterium]